MPKMENLFVLLIGAVLSAQVTDKPLFPTGEFWVRSEWKYPTTGDAQLDAMFRTIQDHEKTLYAAGYLEGFGTAMQPFRAELKLRRQGSDTKSAVEAQGTLLVLAGCLEKMTAGQVSAIAQKYAADHPEQWNEPLPHVTFIALLHACAAKLPNTPQ